LVNKGGDDVRGRREKKVSGPNKMGREKDESRKSGTAMENEPTVDSLI